MMIRRYLCFISILIMMLSFNACAGVWGSLDNPADPEADSWRGYETIDDVKNVKAISPADGESNFSSRIFLITRVDEGNHYKLFIASSLANAEAGIFDIYENYGFSSERMEVPADEFCDGSDYYWRARVMDNSGRIGPLTPTRKFTYRTP